MDLKLPSAVESEKAVLAACLVDPTCIPQVADLLSPEDMYHTDHQKILQAIYTLLGDGIAVDTTGLLARLSAQGHMGNGLGVYLGKLMEYPAAADIKYHANAIKAAAAHRHIIIELNRLCQLVQIEPGLEKVRIATARAFDSIQLHIESAGTHPRVEVISLAEIERAEIQVEPLIDGLMLPKDSMIISAQSGVGKSLFLDYFALAAASPPSLGLFRLFKFKRPLRSLIIQSENSFIARSLRLKKLPLDAKAGIEMVFTLKVGDDCRYAGDIEDPEFQRLVVEKIRQVEADLLFLDPLVSFHTRDENDNVAMRAVLDTLQHRICDVTGASPIIIHHHNRLGQTRGATAIRDWCANMLLMEEVERKDSGVLIKVVHDKCRNFGKVDDFYLLRTPDLQFVRTSKPSDAGDKRVQVVVEELAKMGGQVDTQAALVAAVATRLNIGSTQARDAVHRARDDRQIIVVPGVGGKGCSFGYRLAENGKN